MVTPSRKRWILYFSPFLLGFFAGEPAAEANTRSGRFCRVDVAISLDRAIPDHDWVGPEAKAKKTIAVALTFVDFESLPYTQERGLLEVARANLGRARWEWDEAQRRYHGSGQADSPAAAENLIHAAEQLQRIGAVLTPDSPWQLPALSPQTKLYDPMAAVEARISALQQVILDRQKREGPNILFQKYVLPTIKPMLEQLQRGPLTHEQFDVLVDPHVGQHHVIVRGLQVPDSEEFKAVLNDLNIFTFSEDLFSLAKTELTRRREATASEAGEASVESTDASSSAAFVSGAFRFHFSARLPQVGQVSPGAWQTELNGLFYAPRLLPLLRYFEAQGWLINHIRPEFRSSTGKLYFNVPEPMPTSNDQRVVVLDIAIRQDALDFLKRHFRVDVENSKTIRLQSGYYVPSSAPRESFSADAKLKELRDLLPGGNGGRMSLTLYRKFREWLRQRSSLSYSEVSNAFDYEEGVIDAQTHTLGRGFGYSFGYTYKKISLPSGISHSERNLTDQEIRWLKEFLQEEINVRRRELASPAHVFKDPYAD